MAVESSLQAESEQLFKMRLCTNDVLVPTVELGGNQFVKFSNAIAVWLCTAIDVPVDQRILGKLPNPSILTQLSQKID